MDRCGSDATLLSRGGSFIFFFLLPIGWVPPAMAVIELQGDWNERAGHTTDGFIGTVLGAALGMAASVFAVASVEPAFR